MMMVEIVMGVLLQIMMLCGDRLLGEVKHVDSLWLFTLCTLIIK